MEGIELGKPGKGRERGGLTRTNETRKWNEGPRGW
jgi:hypothetical protein